MFNTKCIKNRIISMGNNFAQTITMLRNQRGLSQKVAAQKLGISQGLLSHYEKGIRECGLDFVIKAAEFYSVSCGKGNRLL